MFTEKHAKVIDKSKTAKMCDTMVLVRHEKAPRSANLLGADGRSHVFLNLSTRVAGEWRGKTSILSRLPIIPHPPVSASLACPQCSRLEHRMKNLDPKATYFKRETLARRYGVSQRTIRNWVDAGAFPPPQKIGRSLLWRVDVVLAHEAEAEGGAK